MGLLSTLLERRSGRFTPDQELPEGHWAYRWIGGSLSDAGVVVSETVALNTLLVVSCVRIIAETIASLPLPVYERLQPRGRERARHHSLYPVLNRQTNPRMTPFTYFERVGAHLALWGNHYAIIERRHDDVVALWPVHPRYVEPYLDAAGQLRYRMHTTPPRDYAAGEILHIPGLAMEGLKGLSPLSMMRQAIGITVAAENYGAKFFRNDARPDILLRHPAQLSDVARENLVRSWQERHGGGRRGIAVLEEGMDVSVVGMPPGDAQFLETRRFQVQELARFFRIPPHMLADVERSTSWGSGIEHQSLGFVIYTMRPWLIRIEQEINRKLFPEYEWDRYYTEFLIDGLLRGDVQARTLFYQSGRQWGYMSANDIRELENMNPIPGGDVYLQPLNMIPAGQPPEAEPAAGQRAVGPIEARAGRAQRSVTSRRRLANVHRTIYRDVLARIVRIERDEVRSAVRRYLRRRGADAFAAWVREYYYERLPGRVIEYMLPPVRTLMEAIAGEVVDEIGGEDPPAEQLDRFAREYVDVLALRHCGDSRSRLLAIINAWDERAAGAAEQRQDAEELDELAALIDAELESWDDRVERDAEDEAHRTGNAAAKFVYGLLGILLYRWVATGDDPCEYCQAFDGRTASGDHPFLAAGTSLVLPGLAPFLSQTSIGHPPLHPGCQCVIAPG